MSPNAAPPDLIETMRCEPSGQVVLLGAHLARLTGSALALGYVCDPPAVRASVEAAARIPAGAAARLRLLLHADGQFEISVAMLDPPPERPRAVLAADRVDSSVPWQYHKTTRRERYDTGHAAAAARGAYDVIYLNERDEVAEASRHNVFVETDGIVLTPPVKAGILPGVQRARILAELGERAVERTLTLDDLAEADAIYLCNAVRGAVRVELHLDEAPLLI